MNVFKRQADPHRQLRWITFALLSHSFVFYVLVTGLAKMVVEVARRLECVLPRPPKLKGSASCIMMR